MDRADEIQDNDSTPSGLSEASALFRRCDPQALNFDTTEELDDSVHFLGQDRAEEAVRFGMGIRGNGFHIYALGPEETDKREIVRHFVEERAREEAVPEDLCYLNNFQTDNEPKAICLPPGSGRKLSEMMDRFTSDLAPTLSTVFESEEYQNRVQAETEQTTQEEQDALQLQLRLARGEMP